MSSLDISVVADRAIVLDASSEIVFQITVKNTGMRYMENIAIVEGDTRICVLDRIAPGESVTFVKALCTSGGERFQFTAIAMDSSGKVRAYQSNICHVASRKVRVTPQTKPIGKVLAHDTDASAHVVRPQAMQPGDLNAAKKPDLVGYAACSARAVLSVAVVFAVLAFAGRR